MLRDRGRTVMSSLPRRSDRVAVMGVLNVTPDSFSDGGRYVTLDDAVAHAVQMRDDGAQVINDVSGGLGDPDMARVAREAGCPWVLMHWRGHSKIMRELAVYSDVVGDVRRELLARVDAAVDAGVDPDQLVIDPGLGFAKTPEHDWPLLRHLPAFVELGLPVLIGASRKSFLGRLLAAPDGTPRPVGEREDATTAITTYAALCGVWGVRVHDVRPNVDAARVVGALR